MSSTVTELSVIMIGCELMVDPKRMSTKISAVPVLLPKAWTVSCSNITSIMEVWEL